MTLALTWLATICAEPATACLMTIADGISLSSVIAVSIRFSPFCTLEPAVDILITSAPRFLPAASNEHLVRVEFSKNILTTVLPSRISLGGLPLRISALSSPALSRSAVSVASSTPLSCKKSLIAIVISRYFLRL